MEDDPILSESLTPRELDILRALGQGLSKARIAEQLTLAPETVKWYLKQLYGKLDAHSREEALAQAQRLGLLGPAAGAPDGGAASAPSLRWINALPLDVAGRYIGRADKVRALSQLLKARARLISIYGRAGAGKTALACKVLGDLRSAAVSPPLWDGVVCLSARGDGISLDRLATDLASVLGEQERALLEARWRTDELTSAQKIGLLIAAVARYRVLILLDNLETCQDPATGAMRDPRLQLFVELALAQSSTTTLLITTRDPLALPGALKTWEHMISLDEGLSTADAVQLLQAFDPSGVAGLRDAQPQQLEALAAQLGGFPRALEAVAGTLLEDPLLRLDDVSRDLAGVDGDLTAAVVEHALARLGATSMQVLQGLAIFNRPIPYAALAFLLEPYLQEATLRRHISRLARAGFIKANRETQQLALHAIDRAYCYGHLPAGTAATAQGAAEQLTRRALHWRAAAYYRQLRQPADSWRALDDLEPQLQELAHLLAAGDVDAAAQLLLALDEDYLWEWGHQELLAELYGRVAGESLAPRLAQRVARRQAWLKFYAAPAEADQEFGCQLARARELGDLQGEADALDDLAQTLRRSGAAMPAAAALHRQALALYQQLGDRHGEAEALGGIGATLMLLDHEQGIECFEGALAIHHELGQRKSLSYLHRNLGLIYLSMGANLRAVEQYREALRCARENNQLAPLIWALAGLGEALGCLGETDESLAVLREAVENLAFLRAEANQPHLLAGPNVTWLLLMTSNRLAIHMALAGDLEQGIGLLRDTLSQIDTSQLASVSDMAFTIFANTPLWLALLLLLRGDVQEARRLVVPEALPVVFQDLVAWVGVLLLVHDEREAAAAWFSRILNREPPFIRTLHLPYATALAHAGLSLFDPAAGHAEAALEHYRQASAHYWALWKLREHLALISLLLNRPGGDVLRPIHALVRAALSHEGPA